MWQQAMADIFFFVEHYVPHAIFDLTMAAPQQKAVLQAVQDGVRYFIIKAPRKGGKTILVAIIAVWLTLRDQTYRFFILSGSQKQAWWLYDYCKQILAPGGGENAERREWFAQFLDGPPKKSELRYKRGGWIMYTAASEKQVNAPTADALTNDEFVLIPTNIIEEAWPMIRGSKDPRRFILSTVVPNKPNTDAFIDLLDEAEGFGIRKFEWFAKDCPFLKTDVAQVDTDLAKLILSTEMFETQYIGELPRKAGRIFPRTFIREAFVAPDPDRPGFLLNGIPYDPEHLVFKGDPGGGIDWGFDHDTVIIEGYRGLDHKIVLMKMIIGSGSSPSDWADQIEKDALAYEIHDWHADASGAFQNREVEDRGLRVVKRAFGHQVRGKEWMIGITYHWLKMRYLVIPDTEEFQSLKKQLQKWKRGVDGKPKKGYDHTCDGLICFTSKWDPRYYTETEPKPLLEPKNPERSVANSWENFRSGREDWMPDSWKDRRVELTSNMWDRPPPGSFLSRKDRQPRVGRRRN